MNSEKIHIENQSLGKIIYLKLKDIMLLTKFRLSSLVVFSAVMSYLIAVHSIHIDGIKIILLALGGFLVTASSNTFNQIIEKDTDRLMERTKDRPLPAGRMKLIEAYLIGGISGVTGIAILGVMFNPISGFLGALALISYAFIYTPFKKISPIAVFIGAVPGSMPLLIGWTAATGTVDLGGLALFAVQFFWQIPHFWSIAWLLNDDYKKAGYYLLPSVQGVKNRGAAFQNIPYLICLIAISALPYILGITGLISLFIALITGVLFLIQGIQLTIDLTDKSAKKLMFASFFYIPIVFIAYVFDKI
ncbi:MAG TPA: heme o synthase [Chitinophagales bacterium]|nr:heme o synthase [Chitinophagales bacterium]MBP6153419.1 heme o synthase [Chitinophagales bacterium]HQV79146.1 heme o synthase [Chitinophagales bacterium]HQW79898.1 heme o synthase [Chitinophagales bacterium]HRB19113.1 heme o synthase [Chitinophagales bacterium]